MGNGVTGITDKLFELKVASARFVCLDLLPTNRAV